MGHDKPTPIQAAILQGQSCLKTLKELKLADRTKNIATPDLDQAIGLVDRSLFWMDQYIKHQK